MSDTPTLEDQVVANLFAAYAFSLNSTRNSLVRNHNTERSWKFLQKEETVMKGTITDPAIEWVLSSDDFLIKINGMLIDRLNDRINPFAPREEDLVYGVPGKDLFLVRDIRSTHPQDKGFIVDDTGRVGMGFLAFHSLCYRVHGKNDKMWDDQNLLNPDLILEDWIPFGPSKCIHPYRMSPGKPPIDIVQYNTFVPPELYDYENPGDPVMPEHLEVYFRYLTGKCDDEYHNILWWMKMCITGTRANNIFVISGRGGIGKTIFSDKVMNHLLGFENTATTDAQNMAKETSNAEFHQKLLVTLEEMGISKAAVNKLKQGATDRIRIRRLYRDMTMETNRTNVLILTNPDTGKLHANANERRFHALKTPTNTLEEEFGPQSEIIEKVKSGEGIGQLYAFLQKYEPKHPLTSSEIAVNNPKYFELVIDSYSDRSTGEYEFLNMLVSNYDHAFPLDAVTYSSTYRSGTSSFTHTAAREFIDGWKEVHLKKKAPAELYRDSQNIWMVLSKIRSPDELINSKTPDYVYEADDLADFSTTTIDAFEDMGL